MARQRKWLILIPVVLLSPAGFAISRYVPDRYRSETLIMVVPQRVPEAYVQSTVTTKIEDRLQSISQQILSRTRLERIVNDFNLYSRERQTGIMEDVIERMRRDIKIDIMKQGDAFRISFTAERPDVAMKVTERLATLFIDENLKDREVLAVGTNEFLDAQLQEARQKLIEQERKLEAYRKQFSGQLPSQLSSNLQSMQNTQMQIQALVESMNRDRDRKVMLERLLGDGDLIAPAEAPAAATGAAGELPAGTATEQLDAARKALAGLEMRLKPDHPDIRRMKRAIGDLEGRADAEALQRPVSGSAPLVSASPQEAVRMMRLREMRAELESVTREIGVKEAEERRLRGMIAGYQVKIDAVPSRESELAELTRDYDTTQHIYQDLLGKKQNSQVAANLERQQIGEQFKILDAASLPQKPANRIQRLGIMGGGLFAGLILGLGFVGLMEYRDSSLKTEEDVLRLLSLPVLALVPSLRSNDASKSSKPRKVAALAAVIIVAGAAGVAILWRLQP